ncbi:MAG TPA: class I SAM-dependent methyltransferase [Chitinivibrionales bacterium]|nr:class I SAM-dependent methyltransferase [Chitinivibrionales bacterium]
MAYWESHTPQWGESHQRFFAYTGLLRNPLVCTLLSLRLGNEMFLSRRLDALSKAKGPFTVLDIGCGWGQHLARAKNVLFYGVDIKGFPREQALRKGYREALEYGDGMTIPYPSSFFDMIIMFNLTAHITDAIFSGLLDESKRLARPGATLLIAAECNNDGLSYRLMNKFSPRRLKALIAGMDHNNFKYEKETDRFLSEKGLSVKRKETICGQFLPFIHYWTFVFGASPYRQLRYISIVADAVLSVLDNIASFMAGAMEGKRFITGYVAGVKEKG